MQQPWELSNKHSNRQQAGELTCFGWAATPGAAVTHVAACIDSARLAAARTALLTKILVLLLLVLLCECTTREAAAAAAIEAISCCCCCC
jgi:hypothetical protein